MADTYTEVTRQGFGGKIGGSFKGMLVGVVLFLAAFPVLFINEGDHVKRIKGLDAGAKVAVTVSADAVAGANEGKLVHMSGTAATDDVLTDDDFGLAMR